MWVLTWAAAFAKLTSCAWAAGSIRNDAIKKYIRNIEIIRLINKNTAH
ncbi:conserved hypothetical protein [Roseibium sp. TrichSKD4]|nr:conserved hypothetical protein [Roseibium sp. TrichSKD4]